MTQRFVLFVTAFFLSISLLAQNSIKLTGKVLNERNELLSGVSIKIVGGGGTTTDNEGRFSLNLTTGKKYNLEFTAVGYTAKPVSEVEVIAGQSNELNIVLEVKSQTADNVMVSAKSSSARKETVNAVIAFQKNTNTVASVISAESIRRSPDKNTGEVLKRTPGASIQEGKFIIIRGLADRYNQAMLNGILLTSTEPDRKTFSFDLIPASMIDNIIINKAFVPEYPGEWAGGLIQKISHQEISLISRQVQDLIHKLPVKHFIKIKAEKQTGSDLIMEQGHYPQAIQEKQNSIYLVPLRKLLLANKCVMHGLQ
jgi:Carboxypeptidase regulatory-like domain/TonB-dependent Receptor Plug Domain